MATATSEPTVEELERRREDLLLQAEDGADVTEELVDVEDRIGKARVAAERDEVVQQARQRREQEQREAEANRKRDEAKAALPGMKAEVLDKAAEVDRLADELAAAVKVYTDARTELDRTADQANVEGIGARLGIEEKKAANAINWILHSELNYSRNFQRPPESLRGRLLDSESHLLRRIDGPKTESTDDDE